MPIYQKTISMNSNELGFVSHLYEVLQEIEGLTITPENPAELFSDLEKVYSFKIKYKGLSIIVTRQNIVQSATSGYFVKLDYGNQISRFEWRFLTSSYDTITTRTLKFTLIDLGTAIEIFFADYDLTYLEGKNMIIIPYDNSYLYASNVAGHSSISSLTFYKLNYDEPYKFVRNFNYLLPESQVRFVSYSSLLNSSNDWVADIQGLYDCSIVSGHSILTINNKRYFSLGQDMLAEII